MKYFTPDLFISFNSSDPIVARNASTRWDIAVVAYDKYLQSIRAKLPPPLRELTNLSLHDAEFIEFEEVSPNGHHAVSHLVLRQHGEIVFLSYFLGRRFRRPSRMRPFRRTQCCGSTMKSSMKARPF